MRRTVFGILMFGSCLWNPIETLAAVSDEEFDAMRKRLGTVEKELSELKKHEAEESAAKAKKEGEAPLSFGSTGSGRLIYAKPFVSAPKTTVGGYMDLQYRLFNSSNATGIGQPGTGSASSSFDQQRFVPFFYSDVTDRIKVAAELEIEHGIRSKSAQASSGGIEVSLEFATIDYLIKEPLNFRAGVLLLPLGKFNLLHDSPLNELSDRPLVATAIIPSTLSETGAGFYGTLYPSRLSKLDYELYVSQGFQGYDTNGAPVIGAASGLRNARQRVASTADDGLDNNNGKAVVGRVAFSPMLGIELGGSGYFGSYDPMSKRPLAIWAADWTFQRGPFQLIGEAAWAYARDNHLNLDGTPSTELDYLGNSVPRSRRMSGYYVQGNYHFMPQFLRTWAPTYFTEASTFTAVVRWDDVNTNDERSDTARQRLTFGLNFRPLQDTVFKADYQFNYEDGKNNRIRNDGLVLSVATYF
jgi:hypothetical protein